MVTPDDLDRRFTLLTAAARFEELRTRDSLAPRGIPGDPASHDGTPPAGSLNKEEALELLALGEVLGRKANYGRQLGVRTARAAGASWAQIGAAVGTTKQSAWEAHARWISEQAEQYRRSGYQGFDEQDTAVARALAGHADEEST